MTFPRGCDAAIESGAGPGTGCPNRHDRTDLRGISDRVLGAVRVDNSVSVCGMEQGRQAGHYHRTEGGRGNSIPDDLYARIARRDEPYRSNSVNLPVGHVEQRRGNATDDDLDSGEERGVRARIVRRSGDSA